MGILSRRKDPERLEFETEALRHMDALYGTALRLTRSDADAQDLVQDTLLRAYRFHDRFEPGTNMKAWLFKIQYNAFVNRYRRGSLERSIMETLTDSPSADSVMSSSTMRALVDPDSEAMRPLMAAEIERALATLPDDYRVMIMLADVEELTYKEIADVIGCPMGTVMSRLHRARRLMQTALADAPAVEHVVTATTDAVSLSDYRRRKAGVDT
jgi:RNA polymerase sigma-70 factor (ECF subfamily)